MKAVALILALAVITGCQARVVRQADVIESRWQDTVNRFWEQIDSLSSKTDEVIKNIKTSQLSKELDTLITDTMAELAVYKSDMQTNLAPYTETSFTQMREDLGLLFNKLQKDMTDAKERNIEYLGELKAMVDQNSDDVRSRITTFTNKLKKRLTKDTEEITDTVATYVGEIQSRATQNLDSVRKGVEPYVQQAGDTASDKMSAISIQLRSQAEELAHQMETQAENFQTELEASAKELRITLENKMRELTDLVAPLAAQLRGRLEGIVETIKETASA